MKGWLQPCSTDTSKAYCKYCKSFVNAKLGDIKKHSKSLKHNKAAEKPSSCPRQQKLNLTHNNNKVVTTQQRKEDDFESHLDPNPYLGFAFEKSCNDCHLDQQSKEMIKGRCISFLIELAKQLKQRLPDNITILNKMQYFSVTECLKPNEIPITDIATQFYDVAQTVSRIENLINWAETQSTEQFWIEILIVIKDIVSDYFEPAFYIGITKPSDSTNF
ncbi:unnamed protein product [Phaedon cochleariae]|uniref:Uncharacterized protein n=1 Tax=Phaedon cochleariae TaxID=80249 RepID=A0A9N9SJU0_PHACE|nr:unnamed protein product [Phaedon cochleariae]